MTRTLLFLILSIAAKPAMAGQREKTYPVGCDRLWAAIKATSVPPHYNYAVLDEARRKGVVSTGGGPSGKRYLQISLTGSGDTCTLAIEGVFSGLAHDDKGDLLKRVDEALLAAAPAFDSDAHTRVATATALSAVDTKAPSEPVTAGTTAQTMQGGSPVETASNSRSIPAATNGVAMRVALTVAARCAKDPDPMGFVSSDMYSSCKQAELNKLTGWITAELGSDRVLLANGADGADYRLTVTLTKSMLKTGPTDFSAGTQKYEASYELVDAAGHAAQNGTVPFQCSGNDKNGEQKFAAKIADTVAGFVAGSPAAGVPDQGTTVAAADTGRQK
jgi:hypothetical protein